MIVRNITNYLLPSEDPSFLSSKFVIEIDLKRFCFFVHDWLKVQLIISPISFLIPLPVVRRWPPHFSLFRRDYR